MSETNTAMGLAFIQAQQRVNQESKVEATTRAVIEAPQPETKSIASRVFEHLRDEGVPLDVVTIASAMGLEKQKVSVAIFQLKKSGYVTARSNPGSYLTYEAREDVEYGSVPRGAKRKDKPVSQVVTPEPRKIMQATPAPVGLKLTIQTSDSSFAFTITQAREIHQQLSALFGGAITGTYDD